MPSRLVADFISLLLILLFAYTASSKLFDQDLFATTLSRTSFIAPGAAALAWLVPLSELGIALLLLFPKTRLAGLYASAALLSVFTVYLVLMLLFAPHLPCSCGGVISGMGWELHVGMNVGLIVVTGIGIRSEKAEFRIQESGGKSV